MQVVVRLSCSHLQFSTNFVCFYSVITCLLRLLLQSHKPYNLFENQYGKESGRGFGALQGGAHIQGARVPWRLNFIRRSLIFSGPQHRTCWIPPFWRFGLSVVALKFFLFHLCTFGVLHNVRGSDQLY